MKTRREFVKLVGQGAAGGLLLRTIPVRLGRKLLWRGGPVGLGAAGLSLATPRRAAASPGVVLDPNNPTPPFTHEGAPNSFSTGTVLSINDNSVDDISNFFADDPDAAKGGPDLDIVTKFRVASSSTRNGVEAGVRFVINEGGTDKNIVAACITRGGVDGIALAIGTQYNLDTNYRAFAVAPWSTDTKLRVRRTADGAEIVEVNDLPPVPRAFVLRDTLPSRSRTNPTVEFGCPAGPARAELIVFSFESVRVNQPVAVTLFASFAARAEIELGPPGANKDDFEVKGIFTLGDGSDGIDIPTEIVSLELSGGSGGFSTSIPAGSFRMDKKGRFKFETIIDVGVFEMVIRPLGGDSFKFEAEGEGFNLGAIANPITVKLTIGDDGGSTTVTAEIESP